VLALAIVVSVVHNSGHCVLPFELAGEYHHVHASEHVPLPQFRYHALQRQSSTASLVVAQFVVEWAGHCVLPFSPAGE
jgi:hypothetical protein